MNLKRTILIGDCREKLKEVSSGSVQCCVTSPPYWGLRSYLPKKHPDKAREIGQETTPEIYVTEIVKVFDEVHRILKPDGLLWLNLGDGYAGSGKGPAAGATQSRNVGSVVEENTPVPIGLKRKDLIGLPWMVAFALRSTGWYLRADVIWAKPNPTPESVTDRPTKAHEYVFLLSKSAKYYYDAAAIRTPPSEDMLKQIQDGYDGHATKDFFESKAQNASDTKSRIIEGKRKILVEMRTTPDNWDISKGEGGHGAFHKNGRAKKERDADKEHKGLLKWDNLTTAEQMALGGNARTVWTIPTSPYKDSHFATFPSELARRCILAGSRAGDTILDPFAGSGTTGEQALVNGRHFVGVELNRDYLQMIEARTQQNGFIL